MKKSLKNKVAQLLNLVFLFILQTELSGCKLKNKQNNTVKTLDNFASGSEIHVNECVGTNNGSVPDKLVISDDKNLATTANKILTAVPPIYLKALSEAKGAIVISNNIDKECGGVLDTITSSALREKGVSSFDSCTLTEIDPQSKQIISLRLLFRASELAIKKNLIKSIGYFIGQTLPYIAYTGPGQAIVLEKVPVQFQERRTQVAKTFLQDYVEYSNFTHRLGFGGLDAYLGSDSYTRAYQAINIVADGKARDVYSAFSFGFEAEDPRQIKDKRLRAIERFEAYTYANAFDSFYCNTVAPYDEKRALDALDMNTKLTLEERNAALKNTRKVMQKAFHRTYGLFLDIDSQIQKILSDSFVEAGKGNTGLQLGGRGFASILERMGANAAKKGATQAGERVAVTGAQQVSREAAPEVSARLAQKQVGRADIPTLGEAAAPRAGASASSDTIPSAVEPAVGRQKSQLPTYKPRQLKNADGDVFHTADLTIPPGGRVHIVSDIHANDLATVNEFAPDMLRYCKSGDTCVVNGDLVDAKFFKENPKFDINTADPTLNAANLENRVQALADVVQDQAQAFNQKGVGYVFGTGNHEVPRDPAMAVAFRDCLSDELSRRNVPFLGNGDPGTPTYVNVRVQGDELNVTPIKVSHYMEKGEGAIETFGKAIDPKTGEITDWTQRVFGMDAGKALPAEQPKPLFKASGDTHVQKSRIDADGVVNVNAGAYGDTFRPVNQRVIDMGGEIKATDKTFVSLSFDPDKGPAENLRRVMRRENGSFDEIPLGNYLDPGTDQATKMQTIDRIYLPEKPQAFEPPAPPHAFPETEPAAIPNSFPDAPSPVIQDAAP